MIHFFPFKIYKEYTLFSINNHFYIYLQQMKLTSNTIHYNEHKKCPSYLSEGQLEIFQQ